MENHILKKFNENTISTSKIFGFLLYIIVDPERDVFHGNFPLIKDLKSLYSKLHSNLNSFFVLHVYF